MCLGDRQLQLTKVLERTPSASFVDALESFVAWMVNAEQLLASETLVVDELPVMEHQLSQYMVRVALSYLLNDFFCPVDVSYFKLHRFFFYLSTN